MRLHANVSITTSERLMLPLRHHPLSLTCSINDAIRRFTQVEYRKRSAASEMASGPGLHKLMPTQAAAMGRPPGLARWHTRRAQHGFAELQHTHEHMKDLVPPEF